MKTFKRALALVLALTVICSMSLTAFAESGSPSKIPMSKTKIVWTDKSKVYNGKVQHASYKVTYDNGKKVITLKKGVDYTEKWVDLGSKQCCKNPVVAKKHTNRINIVGMGKYKGTKAASVTFYITQARQTPVIFKTSNTVKYSKVKAGTVTIDKTYKLTHKYGTHKNGKITCKKISGSSKLSVTKAGDIKVKKGTKKGTYKIKIRAYAAETQNYKKGYTTKTVKVTVK